MSTEESKQIVFLGEENNINLIFEIDLKIDKRILTIKIPPEDLDVDKSFTLHSEIIYELQEKLNKLQIKSDIQIHRLFYLTVGKYKTSNTKFTQFPAAKGTFALTYKSIIRWNLFMGGTYSTGKDHKQSSSQLRINFYSEGSGQKYIYIYSPDSRGIRFSPSGMTYYHMGAYHEQYSGTHAFGGTVELGQGDYVAQVEVKVEGEYALLWNSKYGDIYFDITIYPQV